VQSINNNSSQALNINTALLASGSGTKTLTLGGTGSGISTFAGAITRGTITTLNLTKSGSGTWVLSGENTYNGGTTISGGILRLDNSLALQNSPLQTTGSIAGNGTNGLRVNTGVTALTLGGLNGNKNFAATGGVFTTTSGGYSGVTALTLNPSTGMAPSYSGIIADGAAGMTLTKSGLGTQTLTAANTYTGNTNVNAGTLAFSGGSLTSAITVATGASLGFTLDSPTTSTSSVNLTTGTVKIIGTPTLASYTLMTASAITGTPVLDTPIPDYALVVENGNTLKLNATSAAGYNSWAAANGAGVNLNDDHDADGVSNGVEYFIGGPTGNTTGFTALPAVVNESGTLSVTWTKAASYTGTYGTDFYVETSTTLEGVWTVEATPGTVAIMGNDVKYTFPTPLGSKRFARLKVTGP
jgi:autotransporter-associated beta strand protein